MNVLAIIFCAFLLINSVNLAIIDEQCLKYYSIFGIHINNIKIETCDEVKVGHLSVEQRNVIALYILDNKNKSLVSEILYLYDGVLMNQNTPIFLSFNDYKHDDTSTANRTFVKEFAPDLVNFSLYHNPSKNIAMVLFYYGSFSAVEGVVGDYTLRYIERTQQYVWLKMRHNYERIPIDWTSLGAPEIKHLQPADFNLHSTLDAVNISIIVILDNISIQEKSPTELMKCLLIYFNAANMLYSNFTSPKIQLVIKLLIIPITVYGKTYDLYRPLEFDEATFAPSLDPEVILYMRITPICRRNDSKICVHHGKVMNNRLYCDDRNPLQPTPSIYQIRHIDFHHGYSKAAQMLALTLNASLLDYTDECSGIMNAYQDPPDLPLSWSKCTINKLSNYFRSINATCFREIPLFS